MGLQVRTCNADEMVPETAKIGPLVAQFHHIIKDKAPQTTYCVYTDYESDHRGAYTFFIGQATDTAPPAPLSELILPAQSCLKYSPKRGPMPNVVVHAWQNIWAEEDAGHLQGQRAYRSDFECYAATETDMQNMGVDIFVGIHD